MGNTCPGWAGSGFTVVGMESNTAISKSCYKKTLFHVLTAVALRLPPWCRPPPSPVCLSPKPAGVRSAPEKAVGVVLAE